MHKNCFMVTYKNFQKTKVGRVSGLLIGLILLGTVVPKAVALDIFTAPLWGRFLFRCAVTNTSGVPHDVTIEILQMNGAPVINGSSTIYQLPVRAIGAHAAYPPTNFYYMSCHVSSPTAKKGELHVSLCTEDAGTSPASTPADEPVCTQVITAE